MNKIQSTKKANNNNNNNNTGKMKSITCHEASGGGTDLLFL